MNTNNDYIPEGLEFREEFMHQAFEMYDAEKKKRKKRIIFFLSIFSVLSCIAVILFYSATQTDLTKHISQTKNTTPNRIENKPTTHTNSSITTVTSIPPNNSKKEAPTTIQSSFSNLLKTPVQIKSSTINHIESDSKDYIEKIVEQKVIENTPNLSTTIPKIEIGAEENTLIAIDPKGTTNEKDVIKTQEIDNPMIDSTTTVTTQNENIPAIIDPADPKNFFIYKTHQFWANTGLNALYNYSTNQHKLNSDYSFGLGYTYNNHSKISVGGSVEFYSVSNMIGAVEIIDKIYGFRASYRHTSISTQSLQYTSIKPHLVYTIWNRHQINLAYNLDVLTSSKNKITSSETFSDYTKDYGTISGRNYNQGYKRFNHAVSFGYICNLTNRFAIGCSYNYGLTDITKNTFFTNLSFDRNSRMLFYLKVNIN